MTVRKQPVRTCVACREGKPKSEMLRVVRTPEGEVKIDRTGKCAGRGAYICNDPACIEKCVKKRIFDKVFGVRLSDEDYASIAEQYGDKP